MGGIEERLDAAERIIQNPNFRRNSSLGGKAGYYVFDYPEETEWAVRERIACMVGKNDKDRDGYELVVFDLYDILIDLLEREGILEQCFKFEKAKGMERIVKALGNLLQISEEECLIVRYIREHTPAEAVVFLTGAGKCCRILHSYRALSNLHQAVDRAPVVLFCPGCCDGQRPDPITGMSDDRNCKALRLVK